jgi:hypothetical protein
MPFRSQITELLAKQAVILWRACPKTIEIREEDPARTIAPAGLDCGLESAHDGERALLCGCLVLSGRSVRRQLVTKQPIEKHDRVDVL